MEPIIIPRNTLVVLCGPAGCGKSTFAAAHFLPTQVVSSDHCRALVSDDAANQRVSQHAFDLMHFIIEKRLLLHRLTVSDATNLRRESRRVMTRMAEKFKVNVAAIVFDVSLETCMRRNAARERVVPEDALRNQHGLLQATLAAIRSEPFDLVFILGEEDQSSVTVEISAPRKPRTDAGS